ncbi:MAG: hypothetical protein LWY06_02700 [Firmicutes bacterium]|nr:hypothetical protein [Bacillota bacterium]
MINQIQSSVYTGTPAQVSTPAPKPQSQEAPASHGDSVEIGGHTNEVGGHKPEHHKVHHEDKFDYIDDGMKGIHVAAEVAHSAHVAGLAAGVAVGGAAVAGLYFGMEGVRDMKRAIEEKDVTEGVKATGHLALAGQAVINTAVEASSLSAVSSAIGPAVSAALESPITHTLGLGLGVAYGAAELIVGGKEVYDGFKENNNMKKLAGTLEMGMGTAVAAIAFGGGPMAGLALTGFFAARMLMKNQSVRELLVKAIGEEEAKMLKANFTELINTGHLVKHVHDDIQ